MRPRDRLPRYLLRDEIERLIDEYKTGQRGGKKGTDILVEVMDELYRDRRTKSAFAELTAKLLDRADVLAGPPAIINVYTNLDPAKLRRRQGVMSITHLRRTHPAWGA